MARKAIWNYLSNEIDLGNTRRPANTNNCHCVAVAGSNVFIALAATFQVTNWTCWFQHQHLVSIQSASLIGLSQMPRWWEICSRFPSDPSAFTERGMPTFAMPNESIGEKLIIKIKDWCLNFINVPIFKDSCSPRQPPETSSKPNMFLKGISTSRLMGGLPRTVRDCLKGKTVTADRRPNWRQKHVWSQW